MSMPLGPIPLVRDVTCLQNEVDNPIWSLDRDRTTATLVPQTRTANSGTLVPCMGGHQL